MSRLQARPGLLGFIGGHLGFDAIFKDPKANQFQRDLQTKAKGRKASDPTAFNRKRSMPLGEDHEATDEHAWGHVSLCDGPEDMLIKHGLGQGVMWYFKFGRFIIAFNVLLSLIALISLLASLSIGPRYEGARFRFPGVFYLSTYPSGAYPAYVLSVTLMLICVFSLGPVYRYYCIRWDLQQEEKRQRAAEDGKDVKWVEDQYEGRYGGDNFDYVDDEAVDLIDYGFQLQTRYSPFGVFGSAFIMAVILGISGVVTFYMQRAARQAGGNSLASFCIALFVSAMGYAWEKVCDKLTMLEYWAYWSDYWKSSCIKVLLFKILNVFTVFLVKRIEFEEKVEPGNCQLEDLGDQFILLVALNSASSVAYLLYVTTSAEDEERNEFGTREFIISQEYVELVYRQFLIGLGFLVMPMIAIFGLAANILEYWVDKFRMLKVCHKPKVISASFRGVLAFYFFFSAMFVLASYPNGAIFILAGNFDRVSLLCARDVPYD